jgi:hypothetical protein
MRSFWRTCVTPSAKTQDFSFDLGASIFVGSSPAFWGWPFITKVTLHPQLFFQKISKLKCVGLCLAGIPWNTVSGNEERWANSPWEAVEIKDPELGVWQRDGVAAGWKLLLCGEKGDLAARSDACSSGREGGFHVVHGAESDGMKPT